MRSGINDCIEKQEEAEESHGRGANGKVVKVDAAVENCGEIGHSDSLQSEIKLGHKPNACN